MNIIQFKRGAAASVAAYSGKEGEVIYNRTLRTLHVSSGLVNAPLQVNGLENQKPAIISPLAGTQGLALSFSLQLADAREGVEGIDWKIYNDSALYQEGFEAGNVASVAVISGAGVTLTAIARYKIRGAYTPWSDPVTFSVRNEWTTFYTASRETSHSTEFSRTTSHVTYVDKTTSYSAQTHNGTSYSYGKTTIYSTSYSGSTVSGINNYSRGTSVATGRVYTEIDGIAGGNNSTMWHMTWESWQTTAVTRWQETTYKNTSWSGSTSHYTSWSGSGNTYYNTTKSHSTQSSYSTSYTTEYNSQTYYQTDYETSQITA